MFMKKGRKRVQMNNLAEYILNEEELAAKMEIVYYLAKKKLEFFSINPLFLKQKLQGYF